VGQYPLSIGKIPISKYGGKEYDTGGISREKGIDV
jgi:hypothetical protein